MEWYVFQTPSRKLLGKADSRIYETIKMLQKRLELLQKRWDHLQDVYSEQGKILDEDHPRMDRLLSVMGRAEMMQQMMEERIKHLERAQSAIEDSIIIVDE